MASISRRARREQRTAELEAAEQPAYLVAAAASVKVGTGMQNVKLGGADWQAEGWLHYDACAEFHQGVNIIAFNLSRAQLFAVDVDPVTGRLGTEATTDPDVVDIMRQFFGGPTGQSQALDRLARHLTVAGDSWILATDSPDIDGAAWQILATTDVTGGAGGKTMVQELNGTPRPYRPTEELLMRVWRPHPKRRQEADAATRSLLPVLRELASLQAMVSATVKSRLASSGILWLPEELMLPQPQNATTDNGQAKSVAMGAGGWLDLITEAMTAPIRDPDHASAVVPLVAMVNGDLISKINHMQFGRDLDAVVEPLRQANLRRLAVGMDMPPTVLTGLEAANHWTAWTITEDFAKAFLAPLLELIVDAATMFYLRRALKAMGRDPNAFAVWFDLSALFPKQVSVDNAKLAWDSGSLSEEAWMAALGFGAAEMASPQERARRMVVEMVQRGNPQTIGELAQTLLLLFPGLVVDTRVLQAIAPAPGSSTTQVAPSQRPTEPVPAATTPAAPARPAPRDTSTPAPPGGGAG